MIDDLESTKLGLQNRYKIIKIPGGVEVMTGKNSTKLLQKKNYKKILYQPKKYGYKIKNFQKYRIFK